ncbi:D-glycero-beta-D-manno-heptose 1,7-bisphosphate 7-phosphatase [Thiotrichales bacterium 19S9-12]|nr:D-glycero-beta-D-manno-heptose 1,7-bisphosphate 7-phosphatase [Thiotrichales bacterium 19S9-11]MCF6811818.1 D-glycero-beta-D-manno-heptose 1,7-bisphosphate 7-phosphatase [Thiotrichales bacterium 19S9-12]
MDIQLVILDRDGVINEDSDQYIKNKDEWHAIDGSIEAIAKLTNKQIKVAVATNQSGISRGFFNTITLYEMFDKMLKQIKAANGLIDYIAYCPHGPDDGCHCRKPNIGLLNEISQKLNIPLGPHVYFIGDSHKDMIAAQKANITPILVKTGKGLKTLNSHPELEDEVQIYDNLEDFVNHIQ